MIGMLLIINTMLTDIKGAVKNPGVYEINANTNINDVINLAGGLLKDSDVSLINLSKKVKDEMVIYIPNNKEKPLKCPPCVCTCPVIKDNITSLVTTQATTRLTTTSVLKTNLNTASINQLLTLNGIGEVIAKRIIEYRQMNLFKDIEEILLVKGVGEKIFAEIKDFITV